FALPTGLDVGAHALLTKRPSITKRLTGCLDEEQGLSLFERASSWPRVKLQLSPGIIVSGSRIWDALKHLGAVDERQATPVDLSHLLIWELEGDNLVTAERATLFGAVVKPDLLQRLENASSSVPEARRVREVLVSARFRSRKGTEE